MVYSGNKLELKASIYVEGETRRRGKEMMEMKESILETIESFLDTCPDLEDVDLTFGEKTPTTLKVKINGVEYLVTVTTT